jgi:alkylhydroperoxidase/carboxymuconolactone decarboxylase family protein YurZ
MNGGPVDALGKLRTFLPDSADRLWRLFGRLDRHFADIWVGHATQLLGRSQLDVRTRFLILTAQYTVTRMPRQLEENLDAALSEQVDAAELLEMILQCYVYTGPWVVAEACEVYERAIAGRPELAVDLAERVEARPARDLDAERGGWSQTDADDPRLKPLFDRYGWGAISTGLRLRPGHHINLVDTLDALDQDFLQNWLESVYDGMYSRGVLDDRTRLLGVVGATLALGETHQSRRHMRAALREGATPAELLEVIFHTTAFFGHPHVMPAAVDDLVRILDDEGKLADVLPPDRIDEVRRIVAARVERRAGVQDDLSRR